VLYLELGDKLSSAERDADAAIAALEEQLRLAEEQIDIMENAAARALDGQPVFRYADGSVVYADGTEVTQDIADGIIWPDNAPTAEEYFGAKGHRANIQDQLEDWQGYRNDVLGGIRDRYDDPDNPYQNSDGLRGALEEIEKARPSLKNINVPTPNEAAADVVPASTLFLPTTLR